MMRNDSLFHYRRKGIPRAPRKGGVRSSDSRGVKIDLVLSDRSSQSICQTLIDELEIDV